ncbi:MAG: DUF11 domain-containing protein, partial [Candidatus Magasanikbacteria bacterium]|nr:DUF11 domain-containing protein [Candidatus Magasanikbacteria bacterium]
MKFVRRCLTKDCFLEVTHLWFLALLVSPIHLAGLYYQRRYRLNYVHAKKLFLLDSLLLVIVIILGISLYSWLTFTPQPEALKLTMTTEATRYRSGDPLTITVAYQNKNSETLRDLQMTVSLPPEFLLSATAPGAAANSSTVIFSLPPVAPTADKKIAITGRLYGTPHQEYPFDAHLFFTADNHKRSEKIIRLIMTPRDSTLQIVVEKPSPAKPVQKALSKKAHKEWLKTFLEENREILDELAKH